MAIPSRGCTCRRGRTGTRAGAGVTDELVEQQGQGRVLSPPPGPVQTGLDDHSRHATCAARCIGSLSRSVFCPKSGMAPGSALRFTRDGRSTLRGQDAAFRRDRRRRHERPGARRALARRDGDRLRPRRLALLRAAARRRASSRCIGHAAANLPAGRGGRGLDRDPRRQPGAGRGARGRRDACCTAASCSARSRGCSPRSPSRARTARRRPRRWSPTCCAPAVASPAFLIGGELRSAGTNAAWGDGGWIVLEADESDRSFLALRPRRRRGHQRRARPPRHLRRRSPSWRTRSRSSSSRHGSGSCRSRPRPRSAATRAPRRSGSRPATCRARGARAATTAARASSSTGVAVELTVPGRHNVLNALAALAACRAAGVELAEAAPALASFTAPAAASSSTADSRAGALVVDDYAHHPTEVRATLEAARTLRAAAPDRLLPAASLLAHAHARARVRRRARARRPRGGARHLSGTRARRGLPRRQRPPGRRAPRPTPAAGRPGLVAAARWTTPSACCAASCARATCC